METSSKKRIIILSATGILLTSLICLFAFRNVILCHIVDKRATRAEQTYGLQIHYQELRMKGCNEVDRNVKGINNKCGMQASGGMNVITLCKFV